MKLRHLATMIVVGSLVANVGWTGPGPQSAAQPESRERFVCAFGADNRFVDIYRLASPGPRGSRCRVDYTRNGVSRPVWSAGSDYAYCVKKAVGLVTQLSKGHFTCRPQTPP